MRVLFIYCALNTAYAKPLGFDSDLCFGISYLAAVVKQRQHEVDLFVITHTTLLKDLQDRLHSFSPDVIAFTATSPDYPMAVATARAIRDWDPKAYLVIGGPHVSLWPTQKENRLFDALCIGEGEEALVELLDQRAAGKVPSGIANLWIHRAEGVEQNPSRARQEDLDALPMIDHALWRPWVRCPGVSHSILISRGCTYNCTYCSNHALRKLSPGRYVRFRSPKRILEELRLVHRDNPHLKYVYFETEMLNQNPEFTTAFMEALEDYGRAEGQGLKYGINLRIVPHTRWNELFESLARAGFKVVNLGLESGSDRVRRHILERRYANSDVQEAVQAARAHGLWVSLYVLLGLPGETMQEALETEQFVQSLNPDLLNPSIFQAYPGTRLYTSCLNEGILTSEEVSQMSRFQAKWDMPGFPKNSINRIYQRLEDAFGWKRRGNAFYEFLGLEPDELQRYLA